MSWMACDAGIMLAVRMLGCTPMNEIVGRGRVIGLDSAYQTTGETRGQTASGSARAGQPKSLASLTNRRPYRQHRRPPVAGLQQHFTACPGGSGHCRDVGPMPRGGHLVSRPLVASTLPSCTNHPNKPSCLAYRSHSQYSPLREFSGECQGVPTGCEVPTTRIG